MPFESRYHPLLALEGDTQSILPRIADIAGQTIMRGLYFASEAQGGDAVGRTEQQRDAAQTAQDRQHQQNDKIRETVRKRREDKEQS